MRTKIASAVARYLARKPMLAAFVIVGAADIARAAVVASFA